VLQHHNPVSGSYPSAARTLPSEDSNGAVLTPASDGNFHSPDMSRYICATRSGKVTGTCSWSELTFTGWQSRCASMTTLCLVNAIAEGAPPFAGLTIRTGRPRSNNFPDAASKSRKSSAVAGRLPA
jgi:hypothetical protein